MSLRGLFVPEVNPDSMTLFEMFGLQLDQGGIKRMSMMRMSNKNLPDSVHWHNVFAPCCYDYSYV